MKILGINALNHDASVAVIENGKVIHHERSLCNFDLCPELINRALKFGPIDVIAWYEKPWLKKARQLRAGQYKDALDLTQLPRFYLKSFGLSGIPISYIPHHLSHAANAVYESGFKETSVVVVDAIGEWNTVSVWHYNNGQFTKVQSRSYPYSLGLFYTAFTELIGLTPVKDEGTLTALSSQGDWEKNYLKVRSYLNKNLHKGIWDWDVDEKDRADIAASVQRVFIEQIRIYFKTATHYSRNCVFTGGCAYNVPARRLLSSYFKNTYVPKIPGDAGSSIGAALYLNNILKEKPL